MLLDLFNAKNLWTNLLLRLVRELATQKAEVVAERYTEEATGLVAKQGLTQPRQVVGAVVDFVEKKQRWNKDIVRLALALSGTTRGKVKKAFAEETLKRIAKKGLTDPSEMVAETIAVVREKQGWDKLSPS